MSSKNLILDLSFRFSLDIIIYVDSLESMKKFIVAKQLLRSATSVGANIREAQHAESRADFIHKMKIAAKESEETIYWLELCEQAKGYDNNCKHLLAACREIQNILFKIIVTAKKNYSRK